MPERLQKLIAQAGIASRRHAEELITGGLVTVNGQVVTELGTKADPAKDHIKVKGKLINPALTHREKVYVLLYKPRGYLSALIDADKRPLVTELLPPSLGRLHPVGRLDFNTEGLIILTNDGDFTNFVTAAKNHVKKVYAVKVKGVPPEFAVNRLRRGIVLDDGVRTAPAQIKQVETGDNNAWFEVILTEGRNQQIRKMFDAVGHSVVKLRRVAIGPLRNEVLAPKQWRHLTPQEIARMMRPAPQRKPVVFSASKKPSATRTPTGRPSAAKPAARKPTESESRSPRPARQPAESESRSPRPARQPAESRTHSPRPTRQPAESRSRSARPTRKPADSRSSPARSTQKSAERRSRPARPARKH
jgi:23S rRNA pseudouridine2605 synthase